MDLESCGNFYDGLFDNKLIESGVGIFGFCNKEVGKYCRSDLNIFFLIWSNFCMSNCIFCVSFVYVFLIGFLLKIVFEGKIDMKFVMVRMDFFFVL